MSDEECRSFGNGIWLCDGCARLVDDNNSAYSAETLRKWKLDAEIYVSELVTQEARLRQLRGILQHLLSAMRILTAVPGPGRVFDPSFWDATDISWARQFIEIEQVLFENGFISEADTVCRIGHELTFGIHQLIYTLPEKRYADISKWKNATVRTLMIEVMRFSEDAYSRYLQVENELVARHKAEVASRGTEYTMATLEKLDGFLTPPVRSVRLPAVQ